MANNLDCSIPSHNMSRPPTIQYVSFNQHSSYFTVGTDRGFRIYSCDPFREISRRDFDRGGGIGTVEMVFKYYLFALVGGGPYPHYAPNKVMIWHHQQCRCIGELTFRSEVRGVKLKQDRIVVTLEQKVYVYNFADLKVLHQISTIANPNGLCEISHTGSKLVLACLGLHKGEVRVDDYGLKKTRFIRAHDSSIACIALTRDGNLLATASTKGTLVRVFNCVNGTLLQEVRRGADRAEIYSLAFSPTAQWLAVSSDKGTVHVFSLRGNSLPNYSHILSFSDVNAYSRFAIGSSLSFVRGIMPKYFSSEWSVAQFRLIEGTQYNVSFGHQKNTVQILGMDGSFYRCEFDPANGGEMIQLEYHNFLKPQEPS